MNRTSDDDAARLLALLVAICGPRALTTTARALKRWWPHSRRTPGSKATRDFRPEAGMKWLRLQRRRV
jgi:hypothetical protein